MKTDNQSHEGSAKKFPFASDVNSHGISLSVNDGSATLVGSVLKYKKKLSAERIEAVKSIAEIKWLANEIKVNFFSLNTKIEVRISGVSIHILCSNFSSLSIENIKAIIENGWVIMLVGEAEWHWQKKVAEEVMQFFGMSKGAKIRSLLKNCYRIRSGQRKNSFQKNIMTDAKTFKLKSELTI